MSQYAAAQAQLRQRLEEILRREGASEGDLRQPHDRDLEERAIEAENDEVLQGLDEMSRAEARQIREALRRIDDGTYGTCARCGRPIGAARLAAVPSALRCLECAP
jgi:DnaK suppressor protein